MAAISRGGRKALARASEQFGLIWPYWCESALDDIDQFVSADLRHQRASEADLRTHPAVNDLVRETYAAMIDLVQDPGDSCFLRRLDDLRAGFKRASAIFDYPMCELNEEVRRTRSRAAADSVGEDKAPLARRGGRLSARPNRFGLSILRLIPQWLKSLFSITNL